MRKLLSLSLIFSLAVLLNSCSTEPDKPSQSTSSVVNFKVSLSDGQNMVHQGETVSLSNNQELIIHSFRLYVSDVSFVPHASNNTTEEVDITDVVLISPGEANENTFSASVNSGKYSSVKLSLGLDAARNNMDPSSFPNEHPLSTYQAMYWSMLKYRFAKFEGKANVAGQLGTSTDVSVAYHTGTDAVFQQLELNFDIDLVAGTTNEVEFIINLDEVFAGSNPFDFVNGNEAQSHSGTSDIHIAQKFMQNLKASMSVSTD